MALPGAPYCMGVHKSVSVAVAATGNAFLEATAYKGVTLSIGGGLVLPALAKSRIDNFMFSGASNSIGLGASVQAARLSGGVPDNTFVGVAAGGRHVTVMPVSGGRPVDYETSMKLKDAPLRMDFSNGPVDIGEFMSLGEVVFCDQPATTDMLYRSAIVDSATKGADIPLLAVGAVTTFPYTVNKTHLGIRQQVVSAMQDATALGSVSCGVSLAGDGIIEAPHELAGPSSGEQLVTAGATHIAPELKSRWFKIKPNGGTVAPAAVQQDGTGAALSRCAIGVTLGFQMALGA